MRWTQLGAWIALIVLPGCASTPSATGAGEALCDALRPLAAAHAEALIDAPDSAQATGIALLAGLEAGC